MRCAWAYLAADGELPAAPTGGIEPQAVQRLDYVYSYDGVVDSNGQKVHRVTAKLNLDTDAAPYINSFMGRRPERRVCAK